MADSIINLELQIKYLEQMIAYIIEQNKDTLKYPNQKSQEEFITKALKELQIKYPNMGIKRNS